MNRQSVVVGDTADITLYFPDAKGGDTFVVDVHTTHPNGTVTANSITYDFIEPVQEEQE